MRKIISFILIIGCLCILLGGNVLADQESDSSIDNLSDNCHHYFILEGEKISDPIGDFSKLGSDNHTINPKSQICCDAMNKVRGTIEDHYYVNPLPADCHVSVFHIVYCSNCGAVWSYTFNYSYDHTHVAP